MASKTLKRWQIVDLGASVGGFVVSGASFLDFHHEIMGTGKSANEAMQHVLDALALAGIDTQAIHDESVALGFWSEQAKVHAEELADEDLDRDDEDSPDSDEPLEAEYTVVLRFDVEENP